MGLEWESSRLYLMTTTRSSEPRVSRPLGSRQERAVAANMAFLVGPAAAMTSEGD